MQHWSIYESLNKNSMAKITEQSWKKLRSTLYGKGVSTTHLGMLDGLFSGDMHEESVRERGIDRTEFEHKIKGCGTILLSTIFHRVILIFLRQRAGSCCRG
jgi:hypothetical protein